MHPRIASPPDAHSLGTLLGAQRNSHFPSNRGPSSCVVPGLFRSPYLPSAAAFYCCHLPAFRFQRRLQTAVNCYVHSRTVLPLYRGRMSAVSAALLAGFTLKPHLPWLCCSSSRLAFAFRCRKTAVFGRHAIVAATAAVSTLSPSPQRLT